MMKKLTLLLALLLAVVSLNAQNKKMKIAVMDFKNGVGVEEKDVKGLSDMLINTLYETGKFSIVERSQIDQVIKEQGFQLSGLTNEQLAEMGKILGVKSVLVGTVNNIASEYNVDIRVVDVESGEIVTTAGANKTLSITYRAMMEKIGKKLADNLILDEPKTEPVAVVVEKPKVEEPKPIKQHFRKSGFTLRPEVGFNFPLNPRGSLYLAYGPSAKIALGYQIGSHFFIGIEGGWGGKWKGEFHDYYDSYRPFWSLEELPSYYEEVSYSYSYFPILADIRWYLIDHKYSFVVGIQGGISNYKSYYDDPYQSTASTLGEYQIYQKVDLIAGINLGFAFKDFEVTIGGETHYDSFCFTLNLCYCIRSETTFKDLKWW